LPETAGGSHLHGDVAPRVLVVNADPLQLTEQVLAIAEGSFSVVGVDSYEVGRALLGRMSPDILVASVRLGRHNGLQLSLLASLERGMKATIVVGEADPVLQSEATRMGARYLVTPCSRADLQGVVGRLAAGAWSPRACPRFTVAQGIPADAGNISARVTDISYGGFRLHLAADESLSRPFVLTLAHAGVAIAARPIWSRPSGEGIECGAALRGADSPALERWRALVDQKRGIARFEAI
jgi:DNA-binding response OmpR family regulator